MVATRSLHKTPKQVIRCQTSYLTAGVPVVLTVRETNGGHFVALRGLAGVACASLVAYRSDADGQQYQAENDPGHDRGTGGRQACRVGIISACDWGLVVNRISSLVCWICWVGWCFNRGGRIRWSRV